MHSLKISLRGGNPIHYLHFPSPAKPILVLSHGFPGNAYDWSTQFEVLKKHFEVVAPFMLGTVDGVNVSKDRLQAESLIEDVCSIITAVDPNEERDLYFIGQDLGCFLNTILVERYGSRAKGLIQINGLGLQQYYFRLFKFSQWFKSFYVVLLQFCVFRKLVTSFSPKLFLRLAYRLSGIKPDDEIFERDGKELTSIYIYKILFKRIRRFIGKPVIKIKVPTLFIWGNKDMFLNIPSRAEITRFYERAEIRIVKGGHWVNRSNKEHVNRILINTFSNWSTPKNEEVIHERV